MVVLEMKIAFDITNLPFLFDKEYFLILFILKSFELSWLFAASKTKSAVASIPLESSDTSLNPFFYTLKRAQTISV